MFLGQYSSFVNVNIAHAWTNNPLPISGQQKLFICQTCLQHEQGKCAPKTGNNGPFLNNINWDAINIKCFTKNQVKVQRQKKNIIGTKILRNKQIHTCK